MILLLDLGNTAMKWLLSREGDFSQHGRVEHLDLSEAELEALWKSLPRPDSVVIASVAGTSAYALIELLVDKLWNRKLHRLQSQAECGGIRNAYPQCEDLGVDRWAAMVAARDKLCGGFCVIDCGTAITIDLVAADGQHQGGVILPGLALMQDSLMRKAHLPMDKAMLNKAGYSGRLAMANNTRDAVANGACYACVAAIERVLEEASSAAAGLSSVVITGGDSDIIRSLLQKPCLHEPDLVLKGMDIIVREM